MVQQERDGALHNRIFPLNVPSWNSREAPTQLQAKVEATSLPMLAKAVSNCFSVGLPSRV